MFLNGLLNRSIPTTHSFGLSVETPSFEEKYTSDHASESIQTDGHLNIDNVIYKTFTGSSLSYLKKKQSKFSDSHRLFRSKAAH